ncbi:MAG: hypothetical protein ACRC42_00010, partial [Mycoplasma sp.]
MRNYNKKERKEINKSFEKLEVVKNVITNFENKKSNIMENIIGKTMINISNLVISSPHIMEITSKSIENHQIIELSPLSLIHATHFQIDSKERDTYTMWGIDSTNIEIQSQAKVKDLTPLFSMHATDFQIDSQMINRDNYTYTMWGIDSTNVEIQSQVKVREVTPLSSINTTYFQIDSKVISMTDSTNKMMTILGIDSINIEIQSQVKTPLSSMHAADFQIDSKMINKDTYGIDSINIEIQSQVKAPLSSMHATDFQIDSKIINKDTYGIDSINIEIQSQAKTPLSSMHATDFQIDSKMIKQVKTTLSSMHAADFQIDSKMINKDTYTMWGIDSINIEIQSQAKTPLSFMHAIDFQIDSKMINKDNYGIDSINIEIQSQVKALISSDITGGNNKHTLFSVSSTYFNIQSQKNNSHCYCTHNINDYSLSSINIEIQSPVHYPTSNRIDYSITSSSQIEITSGLNKSSETHKTDSNYLIISSSLVLLASTNNDQEALIPLESQSVINLNILMNKQASPKNEFHNIEVSDNSQFYIKSQQKDINYEIVKSILQIIPDTTVIKEAKLKALLDNKGKLNKQLWYKLLTQWLLITKQLNKKDQIKNIITTFNNNRIV